jgi:hypothetical protein
VVTLGVTGSLLAGCTVRPATQRSIALATPSMRHGGQVAIYSELCDVPAPMRMLARLEVTNGGRERIAIERDLADQAARSGANAIVLDPLNRWTLGAAYTSAAPNKFDPFRFSRATAVLVLPVEATATPAVAGYRMGSLTCGPR